MESGSAYGTAKIDLNEDGTYKYLIEPFEFNEEEKKILGSAERTFTQVELEGIRKEPDIAIRRRALYEYFKRKIPETQNREAVLAEIVNRVMGYGELSRLMGDYDLEEIMVNGTNLPVYVFHKKYGMCSTNLVFHKKEEIFKIINKICWLHEKEIAPIIDLSTIDGSRVNITTDPVAIHGPTITIRKQKTDMLTITQLIDAGTLDLDLAAMLWLSVDGMGIAPANIVIGGMIGSGKTALLNALLMLSPPENRVITIEDTPEIRLSGRSNWVPLVVQEGYSMKDLVKNTLRMRPTRIVVGEIRGEEALSIFDAMNVGHSSMGTIHGNSGRDIIRKLKSPPMGVPTAIVSNLDLIVVCSIFNVGGCPVRRITEVSSIGGVEGDNILLGEVFTWGKVEEGGKGTATGAAYLDKLARKLIMPKKKLVLEMSKRREVLRNLVQNEILDYNSVLAAINEFYLQESGNSAPGDMAKDISE